MFWLWIKLKYLPSWFLHSSVLDSKIIITGRIQGYKVVTGMGRVKIVRAEMF